MFYISAHIALLEVYFEVLAMVLRLPPYFSPRLSVVFANSDNDILPRSLDESDGTFDPVYC